MNPHLQGNQPQIILKITHKKFNFEENNFNNNLYSLNNFIGYSKRLI